MRHTIGVVWGRNFIDRLYSARPKAFDRASPNPAADLATAAAHIGQ